MSTRLGETKENTLGTPMKIIRYGNSGDIDVEFLDDFHYVKEHQTYVNFKRGSIKNPYDRTVYGIGYIGVGKYNVAKNESDNWKLRYSVWRNILGRVYCEKTGHRHKAYAECEVCEEWHNYQNFSEWYETNMYQVGTEKMQIDKDILYPGNKVYSPDKCLIVPQSINLIFVTKERKVDADLPTGIKRVHYADGTVKYSASYNENYFGVFEDLNTAIDTYMKAKRNHIKEVAEAYKDKIPNKVYEALLKW